jgi:hypothetical protein
MTVSAEPQEAAERYLARAGLEEHYGPEHAPDRIRQRIKATCAAG